MANETIKEVKTFSVGVSELYKAWTKEEALKAWWKPGGRNLQAVQAELQEGGHVTYTFETDDKSNGELVIEGNYEEVVPEEKLVYTWNWKLNDAAVENGEYKLHVHFSDDENGSKLSITQETSGGHEAIHPHKEGWDKALENLETYLSA